MARMESKAIVILSAIFCLFIFSFCLANVMTRTIQAAISFVISNQPLQCLYRREPSDITLKPRFYNVTDRPMLPNLETNELRLNIVR